MSRYFHDTSALVKRYHIEVGTTKVRTILDELNAEHLIARLTTVEILSGFAIKVRTGILSTSDFHRLHGLFLGDVKRRVLRPVRALNADYELAGDLILITNYESRENRLEWYDVGDELVTPSLADVRVRDFLRRARSVTKGPVQEPS